MIHGLSQILRIATDPFLSLAEQPQRSRCVANLARRFRMTFDTDSLMILLGRNWDYRYSWLRDSAFTVYALLRLGFTDEADHYVDWLSGLLRNRNKDGSLQIMYTIHGGKDIPELELPHLDGHKGERTNSEPKTLTRLRRSSSLH